MKQLCKRERIAALLTLALLLAGFAPTHQAYAATIINVTTFADNMTVNGDCSLREAIQAANIDSAVDACPAGSGADTIQLSAGIYTLTVPIAISGGDLNITGDLTILGTDFNSTTIDASNIDRAFYIHAGATVVLQGMSITHGASTTNGGAIYVDQANLSLNRAIVSYSTASGNGGGIFNDAGTVTINESTINNNQAHQGGGIFNNSGAVTLNACIVNDNGTTSGGDGGGIYNNATLIVNGCWIHDNRPVAGNGAGIYNLHTATIIDSTVADNYANLNGGNIYNGNGAAASLTMTNSEVKNGHASANGGGIYNGGALNLTNTTITTNHANLGDGIYNEAGTTQPVSLTNSTIVSNTESLVAVGEGIYNDSSTPIVLKNTLIAYNGTLGDCSGPITSAGHNLEYNLAPNGNTCNLIATGDLTGANPMLGPFQNNSGKTSTYALLAGSPAINAGTNDGCPATDQRHVSRPRGPSCDIGAYEANDKPSTLADSYSTDEDTPRVVSAPGVLGNDTDPDGDVITVILVSGPAHGVLSLNPNGSFSYTPDANYHGLDSFSYRASDGALSSLSTAVSLTVNSVNDPPTALADAYTGDHDTPLIRTQPGVLGNDTDADADLLTATLVSGPAHGVLSLNANGSFSYTPNPSYTGPDNFSYRAGDGASFSATAIVTLTIRGQNSPPIAANDIARTTIDTVLNIPTATLLSNDTDIDGDPLTISAVHGNSASGGQVMLAGSSVVYTPPTHFSGVDSFIYTLSDGYGGTASGTVTVMVGMRHVYLPAVRR
jgi:CSLREA domain-containing protein